MLARHAGTVCIGVGDFARALGYYELALGADPGDPYLHLAIGDVHRRLGRRSEARSAFARSVELALQRGDEDAIKMGSEAGSALGDGD